MYFQVKKDGGATHPLEIDANEGRLDEAVQDLQAMQSLSKEELLNLCIYLMDEITTRDAGRRPRNDQEINQWLVYGSEVIKHALQEMKDDASRNQ